MIKRFALYWHNGRSLGHTSLAAKIGGGLLTYIPNSTVVGITGASKGLELIPSGMDIVKVPSAMTFDKPGKITIQPVLSISQSEQIYMRKNLIKTFLRDFQPHVIIVDHKPEGMDGELAPALKSSRAIKILGLWGALDSPEIVNKYLFSPQMVNLIEKTYVSIHVYIDPNVFRLEHIYRIPDTLVSRIKYTGYVANKTGFSKIQARVQLGIETDQKIVVISFGGDQGTQFIWKQIMSALHNLKTHYDRVYLITGPYIEATTFSYLQSQVAGHKQFVLKNFVNNLPVWLRACDLFVGAGGYNTLAEILANNTTAVVIARQYNQLEQEMHSQRLASMGLIRAISLLDVQTSKLPNAIEEALITNSGQILEHKIDLDGAQKNATLLDGLINAS